MAGQPLLNRHYVGGGPCPVAPQVHLVTTPAVLTPHPDRMQMPRAHPVISPTSHHRHTQMLSACPVHHPVTTTPPAPSALMHHHRSETSGKGHGHSTARRVTRPGAWQRGTPRLSTVGASPQLPLLQPLAPLHTQSVAAMLPLLQPQPTPMLPRLQPYTDPHIHRDTKPHTHILCILHLLMGGLPRFPRPLELSSVLMSHGL